MSLADRLRQLADALPPGGSVVLDRAALEALADEVGGSGHMACGDLTAEAATALGCSSASIRRACEAGTLRAYKLDTGPRASWRIPRNSLGDFKARDRGPDEESPARRADMGSWRRVAARRAGKRSPGEANGANGD